MSINEYIFLIATLIIGYIIMRLIGEKVREKSNGNSIKEETDFVIQSMIFLIFGAIIIFTIYISNSFDKKMTQIVFYSELVCMVILIIQFVLILFKQIIDYLKYRKSGDIWLIISVNFLKNLLLSYYIYNYYIYTLK